MAIAADAPFDRNDNEVERVHRIDLPPALASPTGLVGLLDALHHVAFMAEADRFRHESLGLDDVGGDDRRQARLC
jgi:hypothetical protein